MHHAENGLIAGPFAGGVGEIIVGIKVAAHQLRQAVGVLHGGLDKLVELCRVQGAVVAGGGGPVGLHRNGGAVDAVLIAGAGLFHHHKAGGGRGRHAQPDRHVQPLGQKAADGFFDHFFLW